MLGSYYQKADLVCVPSLSDPLPTVILEALVAGTPVIGSDVGGIPFIIQDKENGFLVPPNNPLALADAIEVFYKNPDRIKELKKNARTSVLSRFSWESVGNQLSNIIKQAFLSSKKLR